MGAVEETRKLIQDAQHWREIEIRIEALENARRQMLHASLEKRIAKLETQLKAKPS